MPLAYAGKFHTSHELTTVLDVPKLNVNVVLFVNVVLAILAVKLFVVVAVFPKNGATEVAEFALVMLCVALVEALIVVVPLCTLLANTPGRNSTREAEYVLTVVFPVFTLTVNVLFAVN